MIDSIFINGEEYRYYELRGRGKYISKSGDAINPIRRNQKVTIHYNSDGYPCFGGGVPVHLYVAYAWVPGYFDGAEVNHKDFDRNNYSAENLEWVTHKENIDYTVLNNNEVVCKSKQGINNGRATFSEDEVYLIRELYDQGAKIADIVRVFYPELVTVKQYKSLHSTFLNIAKRKTWKSLPEKIV